MAKGLSCWAMLPHLGLQGGDELAGISPSTKTERPSNIQQPKGKGASQSEG